MQNEGADAGSQPGEEMMRMFWAKERTKAKALGQE